MSLETFSMISLVVPFDDKTKRHERKNNDKLALFIDICERWNKNLSKLYYPDENVTVDEQLVPFRGGCRFKQHIPSKPAKYGLNVILIPHMY